MSGASAFIEPKLEDTLKAFIVSNDLPAGVTCYTFSDAVAAQDKVQEPFISVLCMNSAPTISEVSLADGWGNRTMTAQLQVRTHAQDTYDDVVPSDVIQTARNYHNELVGRLLFMFKRTDIVDALNDSAAAVGNIGIDQVDGYALERTLTDRSFVTNITMQVIGHPNED